MTSTLSKPSPARPREIARKPAPAVPRRSPTAALRERNCSVGRTIDLIGDGWTFMVLREAYYRVRHFEKFQAMLGIPRQTLTDRLRKLTSAGVLRQVRYSEKPPRHEYRMTRMGIELYPVMLALMSFGDRWLAGRSKLPLQLVHKVCGKACSAMVACSRCHQRIDARQVTHRDGPGAGSTVCRPGRKGRRSADPTALERRRPSSVARALRVIGDRWSFMIIREAFFRVRRFDELKDNLGIATNILTDRLGRLVADGVFARVKYQSLPDRYEYRLTGMGRDLIGPFMAMGHWGDRWLSGGEPPLLLTHVACGQDFEASVVCDQCGVAVVATEMRYVMNYKDPLGDEPG